MIATLVLVAGLLVATPVAAQTPPSPRAEVIRTAFGVPHIRAATLRDAGRALAWVQQEDYGAVVALGLVRARGGMGRLYGRDSLESDVLARVYHQRTREVWPLLDQAVRDVYDGFADGVNAWVRANRPEVPEGLTPDFTGVDVASRDANRPDLSSVRRILAREGQAPVTRAMDEGEPPHPDEGSNAWALAPSRTRSRRAILLRNPHLDWNAGYYEAHVTVPGVLDFYGDFRIGGPFGVVAGFNRHLGWATTNNTTDIEELYALAVAPGLTDHVLLDGRAVPLERRLVTIEYRNGPGFASESRERWVSPEGPVVHRGNGRVYVLRSGGDGDVRQGEQFLRMMRATTLDAWQDAMRIHARTSSNFTYADRAGNILYVWNATLPALPHASGGDTTALAVGRRDSIWSRLVPWDSLPRVVNPRGGYVHNENDPPHFTNLLQPLDSAALPPNVGRRGLGLRSQHALELIGNPNQRLSLEDVVRLKHSYRMLLADRVKPDLLRAAGARPELADAVGLLAAWDNTAAAGSRGAVLFETWWRAYTAGDRDQPRFAEPWTPDLPTVTPRGIADPERAVSALAAARDTVLRRWGRLDVAWGEVHRIRLAGRDLPVGGCSGDLGCFRVLWFRDEPDGRRAVRGGDGWVFAVEFGDWPRARSVLAYGNSRRPDSPLHGDQAEMFARGEMKEVLFRPEDVDRGTVRRYVVPD